MKGFKFFLFILVLGGLGGVLIFFIKDYVLNKQADNSYYSHKHRARQQLKEGLFYDALESSNKAILKDEYNPNGYFLKIKSLIKLKRFEEVEKYIEKTKSLCKQNFENKKIDKLENLFKTEKDCFEKYLKEHENAKLIKPFLNSISKNKVKIKNNDIFYNEFGVRGVKATKEIDPEKIIVEVPRNMLILSSEAKSFICEKYAKENKKDIKEIEKIIDQCYKKNTFSLGLFLLENKNNDKFKDYLNIIFSNDYSSFPITFDKKTMALLKNTALERDIYNLKKDIDHDLDLLYRIDSIKKYDKQILIKVYNAISSRNFGWEISGKKELVLVMYIDLVNHNIKTDTKWFFDDKKNSFCLKTTKKIKRNEEIFDTYGNKKSNSQLLLSYGFIDKNNDKNSEAKIDINGRNFIFRKNIDKNDKDNGFIKAIEFLHKNKEGENNISKIEKEKDIMTTLNDVCFEKLGKFDTTLEKDKKFLEENIANLSFNEINCYRVRIEEKDVLNWISNFAGKCVDILSKYSQKESLVKFLNEDKELDFIVKNYLLSIFS